MAGRLMGSGRAASLNAHDRRGITPLIYGHVKPYGSFQLDLNSRLPIDPARFGPQSVGTQILLDTTSKRAERLPPVTAMWVYPILGILSEADT